MITFSTSGCVILSALGYLDALPTTGGARLLHRRIGATAAALHIVAVLTIHAGQVIGLATLFAAQQAVGRGCNWGWWRFAVSLSYGQVGGRGDVADRIGTMW